jgi:DNA-binding LytR/AlgR family response regulator
MARTEKDKYEIKDKLYVIEEYLKNTPFIKISKSVIANVDKVKNLEVSFNGTLCIIFFDQSQEYVSRKYVTDIKSYLQIGGR